MNILIVALEEELFAINTENIELIRLIGDITRVPSAPYYIKGITYSNGNIITVMNMKALLSINSCKDEKNIIIVNVDKEKIGIAVDKALEIITVDIEKIEEIKNNKFIYGFTEIKGKKIFIINTKKII